MFPLLKILLLAGLLFLDALFLGLDQEHLIVALAGCLSGSFVLTFFRRHLSKADRVIKIFASSLGGIFIGAAVTRALSIQQIEYFGVTFFLTSFVVIIFLRAGLSIAETNAKTIITRILSRYRVLPNGETIERERFVDTKITSKPKEENTL